MDREYTTGFRARMVERLTGPHAMSASALARETGVAQATLSRWLKAAATLPPMAKKKDPPSPSAASARTWTAEQKLAAVLEAAALSGDALGAWLRRNGLHAEQLAQWRAAALVGLDGAAAAARSAASAASARRVRELERELKRKDKALAEAAALLVLRGKVEALWADGADDTDEESET